MISTLPKDASRVLILGLFALLACGGTEDKERPPLVENRAADTAHKPPRATGLNTALRPVEDKFQADPDAILAAAEWVDVLSRSVETCAKDVLAPGLLKRKTPSRRLAKKMERACALLEKAPLTRLRALLGLSFDLDNAIHSYAGLYAELQHLRMVLADQLEVPLDRFPELLTERRVAVQRSISDLRNGLRKAAADLLDGSLEQPTVEALSALVPDPETLVETATHLVNRFVTGPVWQAVIQDVRQRLLKGRPVYQERDLLVIQSARIQMEQIRHRIGKITGHRAEFRLGQKEYWAAVGEYLERIESIATGLHLAQDYDARVVVMTQLQRIPKNERRDIRDRAKDWRTRVKNHIESVKRRAPVPRK